MGNCLLGSMSDPPDAVTKVITSNGGIMEFYAPVTVSFITNEFPGHGIFPSQDLFWKPLSELDELEAGHSYYLLPLDNQAEQQPSATITSCGGGGGSTSLVVRQGHVRSLSVPTTPHPPPYRMSLAYQNHQGAGLLKRNSKEHFSCRASISKSSRKTSTTTSTNTSISTSSNCRFWKVKLVITPEQLLEILSQEARTKELIESVRIVAKGRGVGVVGGGCISSYAASAAASLVSEDWSLSSSGRSVNSSKIDALIVDN